MNNMMDHGSGWMWGGGLYWLLILAILVLAVAALVKHLAR